MAPRLKVTPQILFTMLSLAEGPKHGYAILAEVEEQSGGKVRLGPSSLYYTLGRLEDRGLIEERDADAVGDAGDDPHAEQRRYFAMTSEGRRVLEEELGLLTGLVDHARALGLNVEG